MAAIQNERDLLLQSEVRLTTIILPDSIIVSNVAGMNAHVLINEFDNIYDEFHNISFSTIQGDLDDIANGANFVKTTQNEKTGASRAFSSLDSGGIYTKHFLTSKMNVVSANPGTGIAFDSNGIRLYQGGNLKINLPVTGAPSFEGDIFGGSNIDIAGTGVFRGAFSASGAFYSVVGNHDSVSGRRGVLGRGGGNGTVGVAGLNSGTGRGLIGSSVGTGDGVQGVSNGGFGVHGNGQTGGVGVQGISDGSGTYGVVGINNSSGSVGVYGVSSSGTAIYCFGRFGISNNTMVTNLNADRVDNMHANQLCSVVPTNSGTCTVSGGGFNLTSTVSGVQTRGTGNNVIIESISDRRLKKNIKNNELGLNFINMLRPVTFQFKDGNKNPEITHSGLIYQEVDEILKSINKDYEGKNSLAMINEGSEYGGIDFAGITSCLIKAIQELSQKVEKLEQQH